ncbi:Zn-dependent protease with chaperone function [Streptomyces sp. TE33382]
MTDSSHENVPSRQRTRFPGISSRAYEHPADRSALVALRKLSGFDTVFKALSGLLPERSLRLLFLSDSVRVSDAQFSHLNDMLRDACYILDLEKVPPMYVSQNPQPNAMCIGLDEPIIVVTTGLVELLDEEEMRAVVGHEVGHALSGHAVYRTILLFLTNLALKVAWIPLGNVAIMAIVTALREWFRKSELSADRAGLLVGQDLKASMRGLMKIAGGNHLHEMNVDAFLAQGRRVREGRRPARLRAQDPQCAAPDTPVHHGAGRRAEEVVGDPRLPADHGRPLPAARRGQGHLGDGLVQGVRLALRRNGAHQQGPADEARRRHRRWCGRPGRQAARQVHRRRQRRSR